MPDSLSPAALVPEARFLIDRYDFRAELGRGGMGVVYLARERATGDSVAIKLLGTLHAGNEESARRFAREARTVATLAHPNIVQTLAIEELGGGALAIVSEYIPGRTLRDLLREEPPFAFDRAARMLRDVAAALAHAHAYRIVHRDVKPDNIFIAHDGDRALLADFGIARALDTDTLLTSAGASLGTPSYMAPEQVKGLPVDERADVYSLGLVGWEMLSGARPWDGETLYGVLHKQQHEPLPSLADLRPDIPQYLLVAIEGALAKLPKDRWSHAGELLVRLSPMPVSLPKRSAPGNQPVVDDATVPISRATVAAAGQGVSVPAEGIPLEPVAPVVPEPVARFEQQVPQEFEPVAESIRVPEAGTPLEHAPLVVPDEGIPLASAPVAEVESEPIPAPLTASVHEPVAEWVAEPVAEHVAEPVPEPVAEPMRRRGEAGTRTPSWDAIPPSVARPASRRRMSLRGPLIALLASTLVGLLFFLNAGRNRTTFPTLAGDSTVRTEAAVRDTQAAMQGAQGSAAGTLPPSAPVATRTAPSAAKPAPVAVPPATARAAPPVARTPPPATTRRDTVAPTVRTRPPATTDTVATTRATPEPSAASAAAIDADARCGTPTSAAQRACLMAGIDRNDLDLNRTYQELIAQLREEAGGVREPPAVNALRVQQRRWVNDRDRACMRNRGAASGPLWGAERISCFARMSEEREAELRARLDR